MTPRKGLSRDRIVAAYLELLDAPASEGTANFRGLAARLGCAHTNLYNFFPDWDALRWAAAGEVLDRLAASMEGGEGDPVARYVRFALDHSAWYRLVWFERLDGPPPPDMGARTARATAPVAADLAAARPRASRDGLEAAMAAGHDLVHGALAKVLAGRGEYPVTDEEKEGFASTTSARARAVMDALLARGNRRPG